MRLPWIPRRVPVTPGPPHVRDALDLPGVLRAFGWAALPCLLAGAHALGRNVHVATAALGLDRAPGWRGDICHLLGLPAEAHHVAASTILGLLYLLPLWAVAGLVGAGWEVLFARLRHRRRAAGWAAYALVLVLCLPAGLPFWQLAVAVSFGVVLGKEVFGGTGRQFVHPAVVAIVFLLFAFPDSLRGDRLWVPVAGVATPTPLQALANPEGVPATERSAAEALRGGDVGPAAAACPLAVLLGGLYLLLRRLLPLGTAVGAGVGALLATTLFGTWHPPSATAASLGWDAHWTMGTLLFGVLLLATDPFSSGRTSAGRVLCGVGIGALAVLLRVANPAHVDGVAPALLLGSLFAPLLDHVGVALQVRRREHAHG